MARKLNHRLIERTEEKELYDEIDQLVTKFHPDLIGAHYLVWWRYNWKPDVDGHISIVKAVIPTPKMRELREHDYALELNRTLWDEQTMTQRTAFLDHGLCQLARTKTKDDEPVEDDVGRPVFRIRKFDVMEFNAVARRHGTYSEALQSFNAALSGVGSVEVGSPIAAAMPELAVEVKETTDGST